MDLLGQADRMGRLELLGSPVHQELLVLMDRQELLESQVHQELLVPLDQAELQESLVLQEHQEFPARLEQPVIPEQGLPGWVDGLEEQLPLSPTDTMMS